MRLAGVLADDVIIESGRLQFEDNINPTITGHFIVKEGTLFTDNNANIMTALVAGNFGRAGAEIRLGDGGAFWPEIDRRAAPRTDRRSRSARSRAGKSYIVLDEGGGSNLADVHFNSHAGPQFDDRPGPQRRQRARCEPTSTPGPNGAIENNASDTNIHAAT